jgi:cation transport ATPase
LTVEQPVTDAVPPPPDADPEHGRRYPSTIGGIFYLVVLAVTAVGIGIVATGDWRVGIRWVAGGLVFASLVRGVLPTRDAGMLAVRHRAVDCVMLAVVGIVLLFLASTIPNQPL